MTARKTGNLDSHLLRKLTGTAYEEHDCGRLKLYKLEDGKWIGIRPEREEIIQGRDPGAIKTRHDCMEAAERKVKAGLDDYKTGTVNSHRTDKELKAEQALQASWLCRPWGLKPV